MKSNLHESTKTIIIHSKNDIVTKVDEGFFNLTGYSAKEVLGKSIKELSILLKIDFQVSLKEIDTLDNCYLFTKEDKPKEIRISGEYILDTEEKIYRFEELTNKSLNFMLENISSFSIDSRKAIAVYSLNGNILLQSNTQYQDILSSLNLDTDNLVGRAPLCPGFLFDCNNNISYSQRSKVKFTNNDQSVFYFDISTLPLYEDGKETCVLNIIYDVTEEVLTRKALEEQKEQQEFILDNISDLVAIINNKEEIIYQNKPAVNFIKDMSNQNNITNNSVTYDAFEYYTTEGNLMPLESTPVKRVLGDECLFGYEFLGSVNNSTVYFKAKGTPLYDKNNKVNGGILIYENVTNKMILEEYNMLKEITGDILLNYASLSYPDFKIMYINDEGYKTLKYSNPHIHNPLLLIGRNFFDLYSLNKAEELECINKINKTIAEKSASCVFTQKFVKNGELRYLKTIFQPQYNEDKQVEKIAIVGIDITEEQTSNEELAGIIKTQDEIFINTSHELKTPLNLIYSASQLLSMYLKKDSLDKVKDKIIYRNNIIIQNCYRLTKLIDNILDMTKIESGFYKLDLANEEIVSVTGGIVQSVSKYIQAKGLRIVFYTEIKEKTIALDLDKFERILLNLISNAIKFSHPDGVIYVRLSAKDNFIEISVKDQGIGIAKENLKTIFDKFYQVDKSLNRSSEGTGIGLSLVKSLTELHSGSVSVESTLGEGANFILKFPNRTIDKPESNSAEITDKNTTELIKFEFSDIY